jgi:hypothetical protein
LDAVFEVFVAEDAFGVALVGRLGVGGLAQAEVHELAEEADLVQVFEVAEDVRVAESGGVVGLEISELF